MDTKRIITTLIIGILIGTGTAYAVNIPNNTKLQTEIDSLRSEAEKITGLQQQIATLTNEKSSLQSQIDSLKTSNTDLSEEIKNLGTILSSKDTEINSLNSKVQQLESDLITAYTREEWADTLNLEEQAMLALNYVNGTNDYSHYPPTLQYFDVNLISDPPKMWSPREFGVLYQEAAILLSNMTNSEEGRRLEAMYKGMAYDEKRNVLIGGVPLSVYCFEPYLAWYDLTDDENTRVLIKQMLDNAVDGAWHKATVSEAEKYAYMPPWEGSYDWTMRQGYIIGPLVRWYDVSGSESALKLAIYLTNWIVYHTDLFQEDGRFTLAKSESEKEPSGYDFNGHVDSRLQTVSGIIRCGIAANNDYFVNYGKKVVDYVDRLCRGTGSNSFGWVYENVQQIQCETCAINRMIDCAIQLARAGYPEYWNLVERAARNQLVENQLRDIEWVKQTRYQNDTVDVIYNNVAESVKGGWAGDSTPNDWVGTKTSPEDGQMPSCCVTGAEALYSVWSNIVTKDNEGIWVNLLLNRSTKWVDVNSYSPYEGRVEVTVKNALDIFIRLPDWIDKEKVDVTVDGASQSFSWRGDYVALGNLKRGQEVTVSYPLRFFTETFYLVPEKGSTYEPQRYTISWKGDTVISMSPRGQYYPLYQRDYYLGEVAPMVEYNYTITGD